MLLLSVWPDWYIFPLPTKSMDRDEYLHVRRRRRYPISLGYIFTEAVNTLTSPENVKLDRYIDIRLGRFVEQIAE